MIYISKHVIDSHFCRVNIRIRLPVNEDAWTWLIIIMDAKYFLAKQTTHQFYVYSISLSSVWPFYIIWTIISPGSVKHERTTRIQSKHIGNNWSTCRHYSFCFDSRKQIKHSWIFPFRVLASCTIVLYCKAIIIFLYSYNIFEKGFIFFDSAKKV